MQIQGQIIGGKLEMFEDDKYRYSRYVSRCADGIILRITIEKLYATRSIPQNRYYWGVLVEPLRHFLGIETVEIMHETLKYMFNSETIKVPNDKRKKIVIPKTTTDLTTVEFEAYMEEIRVWAKKKLGFRIQLPNEIPLYAYNVCDL